MNVIIETGEGLSDANVYVGTDESKELAKLRGFSLPCDSDDVHALALRAVDWIENFSAQFPGTKTSTTQALSYPRTGSCVGGVSIDSDVIPMKLKLAQVYAMVAYHAGFDPRANRSGDAFVTREVVGPIRVDYAESSQHNSDRIPMAYDLIMQLVNQSNSLRFVKG